MGRLDAVVAIVESGDAAVKALALGAKVKRLPKELAVNEVYLAFGKSAGKRAVLASFDKAIEAMKKDGTFEAIVKKSFSN